MSTTYPGLITPPPSQDNPNPQPGKIPTIQIPVDADPNNAATMFLAQYRTFGDYLAYLNKTALYRPPLLEGAASGFTAVSQIGSGLGTVTPVSAATNSGSDASVAIKIILGGATGTATFQWSNDGGATYGATQTTAASYTDATSGIVVAFAGVFVLGDVYYFRATDTPIVRYAHGYTVGASQKNNFAIDHHGFACPRYQTFVEPWDFVTATNPLGAGGVPIPNQIRWNATIAGGGSQLAFGSNAIGGGTYRSIVFTQTTTMRIYSSASWVPVGNSLWILEYPAILNGVQGFGFGPNNAAAPVGNFTATGTGWWRFEIGFTGSAIGQNVRTFFNGKLQGVAVNTLAVGTPQFMIGQGNGITIGPVLFHYQSEVNPPTLGGI